MSTEDRNDWTTKLRQQQIDDYERRARNTGNLVYVWMAIAVAHAAGLPMPDWCYGQIAFWGHEIYELANRLDPRKSPTKRNDETEIEFSERLHARWTKPELSPEEALARAKEIFGFSRKGWNAFRTVMIDEEAISEKYNASMAGVIHSRLPKRTALNEADARRRRRRRTAGNKLTTAPLK